VSAYYLYGITRPRALPERLADAGVCTIDDGERAAIVSEVEPRPVEATRRNLLVHADAVEELHQQEVVLPARFGIVLDDRDAVLELLALPEVEELLVRHKTTCELRLRGAYDESVLATLDAGPVRDAYRSAPTVENGIALGETVAALLAQRRTADTTRVLDRLAPATIALRRSEAAGELDAFNVACLVERDAADDVSALLDELAAELSPPLRFTLVGPLPPYSFVDLELPVLA
jgi:Gas vesicle synthesis protein GvpL/GvpF